MSDFQANGPFKVAHGHGQEPSATFSDYPEMNVGLTSKYLNTGKVDLRSVGAFGLEAAAAWKRLLFQGEAYEIVANKAIENTTQKLHLFRLVCSGQLYAGRKAPELEIQNGSFFFSNLCKKSELPLQWYRPYRGLSTLFRS
ncbi:putative polyphosphate-selective porin O [Acetobacter malorum]|uniref:Putative polyphosphate-selective porin O n=1 Tax=Acetobacter malorum TaxID=178901 RepID=A0A177G9S1_9PROT|nr:putative polyphosphate-selective porin O [Acetobacter malorum]